MPNFPCQHVAVVPGAQYPGGTEWPECPKCKSAGASLPIATAPKDGTRLLVWDGEQINIADYVWDDPAIPGKWIGDGDFDYEPTHWQPLPEPPR